VTEAFEANGIGEPLAMSVPHAVEALIGLGELDRAERLLDDFERKASELDRVVALTAGARCRALLLAARGDLRGAHEAIERALAEHARTDLPFERARTLLVQGQLHRRRRQKRATRESLEQALALFEPMGAERWAQRARDELARLGRRRKEGLTASEGRVADLAVQGLSNKEIAQALFVTVHTVEVHLSHAYAKLGVRSRTQLAGRLAAVEV
jgi:DNA-binding CsgD family transcriptional regulator